MERHRRTGRAVVHGWTVEGPISRDASALGSGAVFLPGPCNAGVRGSIDGAVGPRKAGRLAQAGGAFGKSVPGLGASGEHPVRQRTVELLRSDRRQAAIVSGTAARGAVRFRAQSRAGQALQGAGRWVEAQGCGLDEDHCKHAFELDKSVAARAVASMSLVSRWAIITIEKKNDPHQSGHVAAIDAGPNERG